MAYILQISAAVSAAKVTLPASIPATAKVTAVLKQADGSDCPVIGVYSGAGGVWDLTCADGLTVPNTSSAVFSVETASMPAGETGPAGPKGDKGDKGDTGPAGPKGDTGAAGAAGAAGKSAYELAVAGGYTGTQSQWLTSLKGAKGDTGAQGPQGPQGPAGPGVTMEQVLYEQECVFLNGLPWEYVMGNTGHDPVQFYATDPTFNTHGGVKLIPWPQNSPNGFKCNTFGTYLISGQVCCRVPNTASDIYYLRDTDDMSLVYGQLKFYRNDGSLRRILNVGHTHTFRQGGFFFVKFAVGVTLFPGDTVVVSVTNRSGDVAWITGNVDDNWISAVRVVG